MSGIPYEQRLHPDVDKMIYRAEEADKADLRELAILIKQFNDIYSTFRTLDMRRRYASGQQWEHEKEIYDVTIPLKFKVAKEQYLNRRERYTELKKKYKYDSDQFEILEKLIKNEVEEILIGKEE